MAALEAVAPAKLNLYLHIHGKRADGYHLLESLVVFTTLCDHVSVAAASEVRLHCDGEFAVAAGNDEANLVMRAARLLQHHTGTDKGAAIRLTKHIPVGAGLGGGSSDAAAAMTLLNRLWQLNLSLAELQELAPELGADVAMCLTAMPVIAEHIGEKLRPVRESIPECYALMAHPRTPLLTKAVYEAYKVPAIEAPPGPADANMNARDFTTFTQWLGAQRNDLEPAAMQVSTGVIAVLNALRRAEPHSPLVRMSGSGACCYALYETKSEAEQAQHWLGARHPHWWTQVSGVNVT